MELFELIQTLVAAHGPSGDEGAVREVMEQLAAPYGGEASTDTMGNLTIHRPGPGPKVMLCAHMDSIGFLVTHFEKEGFLRVGKLGGIAPQEMLYTPVRFRNGVRGVIAKEEKAGFGKLKLDECYVDIGARDEAQAREMVQLGDTAVYDSPAFLNGGKVVSPYLDNRVSCAILLQVLERLPGEHPNDLYFTFSVQEEVGTRGSKTAAWAVEPDYALAVDVTDVDDTPGSERCGTVRLGEGAAIKIMDRSVICSPEVVKELELTAQAGNIPVQRDVMRGGGTDAGSIHVSRTGVKTGGVSVPCRYIHTPVEMADLSDAQACVELLLGFVQRELPL